LNDVFKVIFKEDSKKLPESRIRFKDMLDVNMNIDENSGVPVNGNSGDDVNDNGNGNGGSGNNGSRSLVWVHRQGNSSSSNSSSNNNKKNNSDVDDCGANSDKSGHSGNNDSNNDKYNSHHSIGPAGSTSVDSNCSTNTTNTNNTNNTDIFSTIDTPTAMESDKLEHKTFAREPHSKQPSQSGQSMNASTPSSGGACGFTDVLTPAAKEMSRFSTNISTNATNSNNTNNNSNTNANYSGKPPLSNPNPNSTNHRATNSTNSPHPITEPLEELVFIVPKNKGIGDHNHNQPHNHTQDPNKHNKYNQHNIHSTYNTYSTHTDIDNIIDELPTVPSIMNSRRTQSQSQSQSQSHIVSDQSGIGSKIVSEGTVEAELGAGASVGAGVGVGVGPKYKKKGLSLSRIDTFTGMNGIIDGNSGDNNDGVSNNIGVIDTSTPISDYNTNNTNNLDSVRFANMGLADLGIHELGCHQDYQIQSTRKEKYTGNKTNNSTTNNKNSVNNNNNNPQSDVDNTNNQNNIFSPNIQAILHKRGSDAKDTMINRENVINQDFKNKMTKSHNTYVADINSDNSDNGDGTGTGDSGNTVGGSSDVNGVIVDDIILVSDTTDTNMNTNNTTGAPQGCCCVQ